MGLMLSTANTGQAGALEMASHNHAMWCRTANSS